MNNETSPKSQTKVMKPVLKEVIGELDKLKQKIYIQQGLCSYILN